MHLSPRSAHAANLHILPVTANFTLLPMDEEEAAEREMRGLVNFMLAGETLAAGWYRGRQRPTPFLTARIVIFSAPPRQNRKNNNATSVVVVIEAMMVIVMVMVPPPPKMMGVMVMMLGGWRPDRWRAYRSLPHHRSSARPAHSGSDRAGLDMWQWSLDL